MFLPTLLTTIYLNCVKLDFLEFEQSEGQINSQTNQCKLVSNGRAIIQVFFNTSPLTSPRNKRRKAIFTSNIMHIIFDSIPVTYLLFGSDNPASLPVHLSESILHFCSKPFCQLATMTSFSANNGPGVNRAY